MRSARETEPEKATHINVATNVGMGINLLEKATCTLIVTDLRQFQGEGIGAVARIREFLLGLLDDVGQLGARFSRGLAVGDGDDEYGFAKRSTPCGLEEERVDHLSAKVGCERGHAREVDPIDDLLSLRFCPDVVLALLRVHETNRDAVRVKEARCRRGARDDQLQVVSSAAVLLEFCCGRRQQPGKAVIRCHSLIEPESSM